MQPYRGIGWAFAVALMAAGANPVQAAWCNVFQVCCHSCHRQPAVSYQSCSVQLQLTFP